MTTTKMTIETIRAHARTVGIDVASGRTETCAQLADGTYGPIVQRPYLQFTAVDARHGTMAVRRIEGTVEQMSEDLIEQTVRDIQREISARAKTQRANVRVQREMDAE